MSAETGAAAWWVLHLPDASMEPRLNERGNRWRPKYSADRTLPAQVRAGRGRGWAALPPSPGRDPEMPMPRALEP